MCVWGCVWICSLVFTLEHSTCICNPCAWPGWLEPHSFPSWASGPGRLRLAAPCVAPCVADEIRILGGQEEPVLGRLQARGM